MRGGRIIKKIIINWDKFYKKILAAYEINNINIDYIYKKTNRTINIGEIVHLPDETGLNYFKAIGLSKGAKLVINDVCYYPEVNGVFFVDDIEEFIHNFTILYKEQFFSGDVIIFDVEIKKIWCYHHSGRFGVT